MKRAMTLTVLLLVFIALGQTAATSSSPPNFGASTADYDLSWWTVDGGGGHGTGQGGYALDGTIGQPDAGVMAGGDYTLSGGLWAGGGAVEHCVYLPLVLR